MGFKKTRPVNQPAVASPPAQSVESMNAEIDAIQKQIDELQGQQPQAVQELQPMQIPQVPGPVPQPMQQVPQQPVAPQPVEQPKKQLTINDVLVNHEQRLIKMESDLFRLGGI